MLQHQWIRLERSDARAVLEKIGSREDAIVFSKEVTDVSYRSTQFYTKYKVYKLTNYATMPVFSMTYLSNGENFYTLDGLANPIYTVNELDPITLTERNVVLYLEFFFENVQGSEGEVFLIKGPKEMPFFETLPLAQQQEIINTFKPVRVNPIAKDENISFEVTATLHYGDSIIETNIFVNHDGKITFTEQNILVSGVHMEDSPYTRQASI